MFKEILKESLTFSWRNPGLWFFGLLTTVFFILTNQVLSFSLLTDWVVGGGVFFDLKTTTEELLSTRSIILLFSIFFFVLIISIFSENFLIFSLKEIKEKNFFNFKKSFKVAKRNVVSVLIICLVIFFIFSFFLRLVRLFREKEVFLFLIIFFWLLTNLLLLFLTLYTIFYLVIKRKSLKKALFSAFFFFKNNWLKTFFLAIILFFVLFIFVFLQWIFLGTGFLTLPFRLTTPFFIKWFGEVGFWLMFFLNALLIFLSQMVLIGFFSVYQTSCWVLFFLKSEKDVNN